MKFNTNTLYAALSTVLALTGQAAAGDPFRDTPGNVYRNTHPPVMSSQASRTKVLRDEPSRPELTPPGLATFTECIQYCHAAAHNTIRREGDWTWHNCAKACKEDPNHLEQTTEAWQKLFVLETQDCERAALEFLAIHHRSVISLPDHLKNLGCL